MTFYKVLGGVKVSDGHSQGREFRDWLRSQSMAVAGWLA